MKTIALTGIWIALFVLQYLVLSLVGWMFVGGSFGDIIHCKGWEVTYVAFVSYYIPSIACIEIAAKWEY